MAMVVLDRMSLYVGATKLDEDETFVRESSNVWQTKFALTSPCSGKNSIGKEAKEKGKWSKGKDKN